MNNYPWLDEFLLALPGAVREYKPEWGWERYLVGGKQFAATCCPGPTYDPLYAGREMVLLKCDPRLAQAYRETYPDVAPGFYSDKRTWNSVFLDGQTVPEDVLRQMCRDSYDLVFSKLTKALRQEIGQGAGQ